MAMGTKEAKDVVKDTGNRDTSVDVDSKLKEYAALDKQLSALCSGAYQGITGKKKEESVTFIPTGCISVDRAIRGIVPGRVYEVFGAQGSAKSSLCLFLVSVYQKLGKICMWLDLEGVYTREYATACGVDPDKIIVLTPDTMNDALEAIRIASASDLVHLIIIDSVSAMVPKDEYDKDVGGGMIGTRARLMSSTLPQIIHHAGKSGCTLIFINQERSANLTGKSVHL